MQKFTKQLRITNIQRGCVNDGPGVRTTIFLKGCNLRCPWCCNPEAITYEEQWYVDEGKCLLTNNLRSVLCESCERVGGSRIIQECPFGICENTSKDYDISELFEILLKDKQLYFETGGGITFSGGEPLCQSGNLVELLKVLKEINLNVALETTLVSTEKKLLSVIPYIDSFIVDLKIQPQMKLNDDIYYTKIEKMISLIPENKMTFRVVFVNEMNDVKDLVLYRIKQLKISNIELLLCHHFAKNKYIKLKKQTKDYTADITKATDFMLFLNNHRINAKLLSV